MFKAAYKKEFLSGQSNELKKKFDKKSLIDNLKRFSKIYVKYKKRIPESVILKSSGIQKKYDRKFKMSHQ